MGCSVVVVSAPLPALLTIAVSCIVVGPSCGLHQAERLGVMAIRTLVLPQLPVDGDAAADVVGIGLRHDVAVTVGRVVEIVNDHGSGALLIWWVLASASQ